MSQELENELFKITVAFINKIIVLAVDKARVEGKELDKKDYNALAKILGIPEKELRKLVMKPQVLTLRQAVKLSHSLGLSVLFTTQGFIKWY